MKVLYKILGTRNKNREEGYWVSISTKMSRDLLLIVSCTLIHGGVSFMISEFWNTFPYHDKHLPRSEDNFGDVTSKEINRSFIPNFLCDYLSLIDEHNKQRHNLLNIERK